jgi:hypothetical protein
MNSWVPCLRMYSFFAPVRSPGDASDDFKIWFYSPIVGNRFELVTVFWGPHRRCHRIYIGFVGKIWWFLKSDECLLAQPKAACIMLTFCVFILSYRTSPSTQNSQITGRFKQEAKCSRTCPTRHTHWSCLPLKALRLTTSTPSVSLSRTDLFNPLRVELSHPVDRLQMRMCDKNIWKDGRRHWGVLMNGVTTWRKCIWTIERKGYFSFSLWPWSYLP